MSDGAWPPQRRLLPVMVSAVGQYKPSRHKRSDGSYSQMKLLATSCLAFSLSWEDVRGQPSRALCMTHCLLRLCEDVKFYLVCDRGACCVEIAVGERHFGTERESWEGGQGWGAEGDPADGGSTSGI